MRSNLYGGAVGTVAIMISLIISNIPRPVSAAGGGATILNVVADFGAKPDGHTDSTSAFTRAWGRACSSKTQPVIYVPKGSFVIRPVSFNGPCRSRVTLWMHGTILGPSNFRELADDGSLITFHYIDGLLVRGGTIDARGKPFWDCRNAGKCSGGASTVAIAWCKNVVVSDLKLVNSHRIHVMVFESNSTVLRGLKIRAPSDSPNTDGIHLGNSNGITISDSQIRTGDDCISMGASCFNFRIQNIDCGPGHGISIGSLAANYKEGGVENITVKGVVFRKTDNGARIKTWARDSTSYVKNVVFSNIVMKDVSNPIVIDQTYCPHNKCPRGNSGVKISGVTFKNITGTSRSQVAITLDCSPSNPCRGVKLQDIQLSYSDSQQNKNNKKKKNDNPAATSLCKYALGTTRGVVVPQSCLHKQ